MHLGFVVAEDPHVLDVGVGALIAREALANQLQRRTKVRAALDELHAFVVGSVTSDGRLEDPFDLFLGSVTIGASRRPVADRERLGVGRRRRDGVGREVDAFVADVSVSRTDEVPHCAFTTTAERAPARSRCTEG